jgi:hypothetical protein
MALAIFDTATKACITYSRDASSVSPAAGQVALEVPEQSGDDILQTLTAEYGPTLTDDAEEP